MEKDIQRHIQLMLRKNPPVTRENLGSYEVTIKCQLINQIQIHYSISNFHPQLDVLYLNYMRVINFIHWLDSIVDWSLQDSEIFFVSLMLFSIFPSTANASHRLNLMYLANDVIQNCKRKNAINYRTAFAEVLPDAFQLVK